MKKLLSYVLVVMFIFLLSGCNIEANKPNIPNNSYLVPFNSELEEFNQRGIVFNKDIVQNCRYYRDKLSISFDNVDSLQNCLKNNFSEETLKKYYPQLDYESFKPFGLFLEFVGKAKSLGYIYLPRFEGLDSVKCVPTLKVYSGENGYYVDICYELMYSDKTEMNLRITYIDNYKLHPICKRTQNDDIIESESRNLLEHQIELPYGIETAKIARKKENVALFSGRYVDDLYFPYNDVFINIELVSDSLGDDGKYKVMNFDILKHLYLDKVNI